MPQRSPDNDRPENENKSARLAQDIDGLHKDIRQDFDQRIHDLSALMSRFKSLMINDSRELREKPHVAGHANNQATAQGEATSKVAGTRPGQPIQRRVPFPPATKKTAARPATADRAAKPAATPAYQPARFETGLYHLNSQLQRFRLELDQELEFRQEPLHVHFRQNSELAKTLQQLSLDAQDESDDADT